MSPENYMQIELSLGKILFDMSFIPICDKPAILNKLEGLKLVLSSLCYILQDADTFLQYYITSNTITTDNQSTQNTVHISGNLL